MAKDLRRRADAIERGDNYESVKDKRRMNDQMQLTADAGQLYNNVDYGKEKEVELIVNPNEYIEKAKEHDERLSQNETSHKMDNVNQDYAYNKEIMKALPHKMPDEVKQRVARSLDKEAHVDSTSSMEMKDGIVKFHNRVTKIVQKNINAKKSSAVSELLAKSEMIGAKVTGPDKQFQ